MKIESGIRPVGVGGDAARRTLGRSAQTSPTLRRAAAACGFTLLALASDAAGQSAGGFAPPPSARGGPGPESELTLIDRFDTDGDERLDAAERAAARSWLGSGRGTVVGGGGRGVGGFPGGPPGGGRGGFRTIVSPTPGAAVDPTEVPTYPTASLYDPFVVRTFFIEFENPNWEQELAAFYNTDVEVPATVTVDGRRYEDVGIGFRGASSFRMVPEGSKRSLNLSFDFVEDDQRVGGYRTLNLLNAMNDPTFVRTVLYSQIARSYLPAPQVNHVRVVINGENWGIYLNAQQFNKDFLTDFFGTDEGGRWKIPGSPNGRGGMEYLGDDPTAYRRLYEIKSKDSPESWAALVDLFRILNQTPPDKLVAELDPILDIDGVLRFLALEVVLVNSDGYWTRASDYNLYRDEAGRFHVVPHDMNEALGVSGNVSLDPLVGLQDGTKPLRSKLLVVPELRERYLEYVREIATEWLDWNRLEPLVRQYQELIAPQVAADTRKLYSTEAFAEDVENLRNFVETRREFLLGRVR